MEKNKPVIDFELYLIRHGQSYGNIENSAERSSLFEKYDPLLTETGYEQAKKVGRRFAETDFSALYSSALTRACSTASEISKAHSEALPVNILPELAEIFIPEEYEGLSLEEIRKYCPEAVLADGVDENSRTVISNEINETEMFERAKRILDYFADKYHNGEKIAVVSHAGILTYIIFYIIGYRFMQPKYDFRIANTGVSHIVFYRKDTYIYGDIVFDCINDTTHLN